MDAALFGLIVADLIAEPMDLRRPPTAGGLALLNSIRLTTGGNVCNTGVAMAKLGLSVAAAGLVGDDALGNAVLEILGRAGVHTDWCSKTPTAQTSASVVAVEPGGERCFFHTPGATTQLDPAFFQKCAGLFVDCKWVQIGYIGLLPALTPYLPELLQDLRCKSPGTQIALDTVNPPGPPEEVWPILPHLDLFAPSRTEATALTGESDPAAMVAVFRRHMKSGVIGIKLDADGCYLDNGSAAIHVPAARVTVVDTTGAGDTWFGGLLTALIKEMPLEQAGRFANRAAADCCTALGASAGVRNFKETLERA